MFTSRSEQPPPTESADDVVRRQRVVLDAERLASLWRERDRLGRPREDAASAGDPLRLVVGPGRAQQLEQPAALLEARLGIGVGVDEEVTVVEPPEQADMSGEQHAVPKNVARHVADAHDREVPL